MSEFNIHQLRAISVPEESVAADIIEKAILAYEQLQERCVMDRTRDSIIIGELRNALAEREEREADDAFRARTND